MDAKDGTHHKETHGRSDTIADALHPKKDGKGVSSDTKDKAKEGTVSTLHKDKVHDSETHGTSDDIDENTSINKVKGPNIFERAKEEIDALVDAILPEKGE